MSILSLHRPRWAAGALLHRGGRAATATALVPTLTDGERVLCRTARDGFVTALGTDAALHYRTAGGAWRRLAWVDITAANWSARTGRVQLRTARVGYQAHTIEVAADAMLAAFASERIGHMCIIRRRVELTPGLFGVVEAIRVSDGAAPQWRVHLEDAARRTDPLVQQACQDVISELRSLTGC